MKKLLACAVVAAAAYGSQAYAIPTLQLGIADGVYDTTTQTVIATTNPFTLSAYLIADSSNTISDSYYVSYAIIPKVGPAPANLGTITIDGVTINVTADMTYGTPPIETVATQLSDPGDLATHSIFPTYFGEKTFQFASTDQSDPFNTADNPADDASDHPGTGMYFHEFEIDVSGLLAGYAVHFDLYNTKVCADSKGQCDITGDIDQTQFAPFSHDAQSGSSSTTSSTTSSGASGTAPEPGTLSLLGGAILGGLFQYRRRRQAHA